MMTPSRQRSPEWSDKWVELQGRICREFPAAARGHECGVIWHEPEVLPTGLDGTEMVQMSVDLILGERQVTITVVEEGFLDDGYAISIFSLFSALPKYRIDKGQSIQPAVAVAMEKVGQLIEDIKAGAPACPILLRM